MMFARCREKCLIVYLYTDSWINIQGVGVGGADAGADFVVGGGGDHGAVVAGELRVWEIDLGDSADFVAEGEVFTEFFVRADAAGDDD